MSNRRKVSFDLDDDQRDGMNRLARELDISFAEAFRRAVGEYLALNGIELKRTPDVHERRTVIPGCEE